MTITRILTCLYLCFFAISLNAQDFWVKGQVKNADGEGIEYATIGIYTLADSSLVEGAISDEKGSFQFPKLPKGAYFLQAKHLLFFDKTVSLPLFSNQNIVVVLEEQPINMDEVLIDAERLRTQTSLNVQTIDAGQSAVGIGGDALQLLKISPLVMVSPEGNISIRGRSDIQIQINGKPSGFASMQGARYLEQLDAGLIEKIEIITNPSAKESAQGGAAIINIVLKKNRNNGLHGAIQASVGNRGRYGLNPNINYRLNKLNVFGNYSLRRKVRVADNSQSRQQVLSDSSSIIEQNGRSKRDDLNHRFEFGTDYFFSESTYLTISGLYRQRDKASDQNIASTVYKEGQLEEERQSEIAEPENNNGFGISMRFISETENPRAPAKVNGFIEFVSSIEDETIKRVDEINQSAFEGGFTQYVDDNKQLLVDFSLSDTLKGLGEYDIGVRWVNRSIEQDFSYYLVDNLSGIFEDNHFQKDQFIYRDNIIAAYLLSKKQFGNMQLEIGLRAEQWINHFNTISNPTRFGRSLLNFFPSAKANYSFSDHSKIQFSYSRKVNLPSPNRLNPFINISQPFRVEEGNPQLKPEFINNYELAYIKAWDKISFNTSIFYKRYKGLIQRVSQLGTDGTELVRPINLDYLLNYGFDLSFSWNPLDFWDIQGGILFFQNQYSSEITESNRGGSIQLKLNQRFSLQHNWHIEAQGTYLSSEATAQGKIKPLYYIDMGVQKEFSQKLSGAISLTDIFNTLIEKTTLEADSLSILRSTKIDTRRVRLTMKYKF